ncbi:MAG: ribbon-helix-helix protein, CopG family [Prosthecobacter sp.]
MRTISLKLPDSLQMRLEQESRRRHMTKSALVRVALERELEQPQTADGASCHDLARDLAGSIKKPLPKDLVTNPRHMKSFGRNASPALESLLDEALSHSGERIPLSQLRRKTA